MPMLVDGAQSAGAIAVEAARYDYFTVSGSKMALTGPDATGGLYVRDPEALARRAADLLLPARTRRGGRLHARSAGGAVRRRLDPDLVARRPGGSASSTSRTGRFHHASEISARCYALLADRFRVATAPGQARLVSFVPDGDPAEVAARLYEAGVVVRDMPGTAVAARLLRLVDERRGPRAAAGRSLSWPSRTRTRDTRAESPGRRRRFTAREADLAVPGRDRSRVRCRRRRLFWGRLELPEPTPAAEHRELGERQLGARTAARARRPMPRRATSRSTTQPTTAGTSSPRARSRPRGSPRSRPLRAGPAGSSILRAARPASRPERGRSPSRRACPAPRSIRARRC